MNEIDYIQNYNNLYREYLSEKRMVTGLIISFFLILGGFFANTYFFYKSDKKLNACEVNRATNTRMLEKIAEASQGAVPDIEIQLLFQKLQTN